MDPLLTVDGLEVGFGAPGEHTNVVGPVGFEIGRGEVVALVGESGSGKTLTALSVAGLENSIGARRTAGSVKLSERELTGLSTGEWRRLRGDDIGFIFQDPMSSLNPVLSIGEQLVETLRTHQDLTVKQARQRAAELLEQVEIGRPESRLDQYPFEFSGGMRQRVMAAIAIANSPELLIADEPTTALDVTVQAGVLDLLRDLQEEFSLSILLITHDLGVVAQIADRILVMYAGELVEVADTDRFFERPLHPYGELLLEAVPRLDANTGELPAAIGGSPPDPRDYPTGCRFHPRCPLAEDRCSEVSPEWAEANAGHRHRCLVRADRPEAELADLLEAETVKSG